MRHAGAGKDRGRREHEEGRRRTWCWAGRDAEKEARTSWWKTKGGAGTERDAK